MELSADVIAGTPLGRAIVAWQAVEREARKRLAWMAANELRADVVSAQYEAGEELLALCRDRISDLLAGVVHAPPQLSAADMCMFAGLEPVPQGRKDDLSRWVAMRQGRARGMMTRIRVEHILLTAQLEGRWPLFVTLTIAQHKMAEWRDKRACQRAWRAFCMRLRRKVGAGTDFHWVYEVGEKGREHVHGVLVLPPGAQRPVVNRHGRCREFEQLWKLGRSDWQACRWSHADVWAQAGVIVVPDAERYGIEKAGGYLAKYAAKQYATGKPWRTRTSHNMFRISDWLRTVPAARLRALSWTESGKLEEVTPARLPPRTINRAAQRERLRRIYLHRPASWARIVEDAERPPTLLRSTRERMAAASETSPA